jgi:peptide/nickel transport system permease protein
VRRYVLTRLVGAVVVLLVVATVIFLVLRLTPGDPARVMLGSEASEDAVAKLRQQLGLDEPMGIELVRWYGRLLRLNLGDSLYSQDPVIDEIVRNWQPTFLLTILAGLVSVGVGIPLGVLAATRHNTAIDHLLMLLATIGIAIPSFWLALNLIVLFAIVLPWFPSQGFEPPSAGIVDSLRHLALPAVALGVPQVALIARMTRSSMLEVLSADYVRSARAKGLGERRVVYGHALRNAMLPTLTVVGLSLAVLIGGAVVVEQIFNIPGLGRLVVGAIQRRDYPVVPGAVLVIARAYVLLNLAIDLAYAWLDPRIKYG